MFHNNYIALELFETILDAIQDVGNPIMSFLLTSLPSRSSNGLYFMMTSSNGIIFRVTGPLCGEFTGDRWIPSERPVARSFDVFFDLCLE